jgi:hypothetical protein
MGARKEGRGPITRKRTRLSIRSRRVRRYVVLEAYKELRSNGGIEAGDRKEPRG